MSLTEQQFIPSPPFSLPQNPFLTNILFRLNKIAFNEELYENAGIFYLKKTQKPFSGIWYDRTNQVNGRFKLGLKTGPWIEYIRPEEFEKPILTPAKTSGYYQKGKKEGIWVEYWKDAQLIPYKRSCFFVQGEKRGSAVEWKWSDYDLGWIFCQND